MNSIVQRAGALADSGLIEAETSEALDSIVALSESQQMSEEQISLAVNQAIGTPPSSLESDLRRQIAAALNYLQIELVGTDNAGRQTVHNRWTASTPGPLLHRGLALLAVQVQQTSNKVAQLERQLAARPVVPVIAAAPAEPLRAIASAEVLRIGKRFVLYNPRTRQYLSLQPNRRNRLHIRFMAPVADLSGAYRFTRAQSTYFRAVLHTRDQPWIKAARQYEVFELRLHHVN